MKFYSPGAICRGEAVPKILHKMSPGGTCSPSSVTHGLWPNPTLEEYACLKDGPGADQYWTETGIKRADMVDFLVGIIRYMGPTSKKIELESLDTKLRRKFSLSDLGLHEDSITQATAQFWSCAQGRILMVANNVARAKASPVPDYLLPNSAIKEKIKNLFAEL
eukprot:12431513-Karenia_brevis.AAC.2